MRGSVVQKPAKTGRWFVVVDLERDPGTGARRQKWHSGFRTKREAERGLARILSERDEGRYIEPAKMTFGTYLVEHWLPAIESSIRPSTFSGYRGHVELYLRPRIGAVQLQQITPDHLSRLYRDLQKGGGRDGRPLSPTTVRRVHATVHRALKDAVRWGHLRSNPAAVAVKPRQPAVGSAEVTTWTAVEVRTFLEHVRDDRLFALWRLAATTGMRRGELLGLRWADVNLDAHRVSVRQTLTVVDGEVAFGEPKTRRGKRNIALDADTAQALRGWKVRQDEERATFGTAIRRTGLVFTQHDGSLINPNLVSAWFAREAARAEVPPIRFHDLRHTHASLALQAGIPAKVVSERLGHATVAFTLDVYSHVIPGLQEEAATAIAALID